ncbi:gamma-secretase-activating protein isoform X2 [Betta splendens]|uniref:Gamma-secretase-activating protein isoform X2 n=1 Tax=Betta splendens TaxID=158456 RepID=A0A9W2Y105_BETSP|nr:gamma-secretase-activating protein isoform X2 [Betta splendens]
MWVVVCKGIIGHTEHHMQGHVSHCFATQPVWVSANDAACAEYSSAVDTRILNIERDGHILYSWKGATETTRIGKYDPVTKHNKLLYSFDKQVCVSSCSLNKEETLLAVSLAQSTAGAERLKPLSKCLTLLIEISPINNTKVLKAVDCRVKVQFLHQEGDRRPVLESHLLLLTEDGYADLYHVLLAKQEGYRVVMANAERLAKTAERLVEDFSWVQWDGHAQRLYYLTHKDKFLLRCVQFYPNHSCDTVLELPLELPADAFPAVKFVNLGFDHYHTEGPEQELVRLEVFTETIGSMCVCYSQPSKHKQELIYSLILVHKDCRKTFRVALGAERTQQRAEQLQPVFIPIGYYILVYLQDYFLHCINTRQQEMLCHSLFFSGEDVDLGLQCQPADITVLHAEEKSCCSLLDLASGTIHVVELSPAYLLQVLKSNTPSRCPGRKADSQCLAALHCLLVYMGKDPNLELKIIEWLCDNVNAFECFDQIQEFILASLFRISYEKSLSLDKVLPYSSVFNKKEVPACLSTVPGVVCTTDLQIESEVKGKGFWAELQWNTERVNYLDNVPHPRYQTTAGPVQQGSERRPSSHMNHLEDNTKKVLSMVDTWCLDKKLVPLFQEEDHQQRALIGLVREREREQRVYRLSLYGRQASRTSQQTPASSGKEENRLAGCQLRSQTGCEWGRASSCYLTPDDTVARWRKGGTRCGARQTRLRLGQVHSEHLVCHLCEVTRGRAALLMFKNWEGKEKELELIRHMLETVWLKYDLGSHVLCLTQQGTPAEWSVLHFMFRILEATRGLSLPLPPGYHTLLAVFAVRCLPHHTFLQYIDHGFLQLTETFVSRLMTDLDNSDANERLKFSVVKRLPQPMEQRIYHMWDHPVSSASISRDYVRTLLERNNKNKGFASSGRDNPGFRPDFLPLTYLAKILSDIEAKAPNPFEEQENVDARFVEETALKQTLILLGFEEK